VRERFNASGCRFDVQIAPNLPPVVADADAMVTALLNLLDNAWKYSGEQKQIAFSAGAEKRKRLLFGQGQRHRLVSSRREADFQEVLSGASAHAARRRRMGLGLSIVQFVVTAHHGTVRVESQPEHGSTFTITVPAADDAS